MTWHKSYRTWIAIVAAASAIVLGIVCYSLQRDLARARERNDRFDDYCATVLSQVISVEFALRDPVDPNKRNRQRDMYVEDYVVLGNFGRHTKYEVELCAATPIDFHTIEERYQHCTSDTFTCLADLFAEVKRHLPRTFR